MIGFSSAQAIHDRGEFVARQSELAALLARPRRQLPRPGRRRLIPVRQRLAPLPPCGDCGGAVV